MDMQKPGPRGRSSSINPGPRAAVECKTPDVARGGCWCLELTDAQPWPNQWTDAELNGRLENNLPNR